MKSAIPETIDAYIAGFPEPIRERLEAMRATIRKAAPDAGEKIAYRIPTFTLAGNLVHFAAFKHHIGFFPGSSGIKRFKRELAAYNGAKGSVQFPFDEPLPLDVVARIVEFRAEENLEIAEAMRRKKLKNNRK
jgi:uncharacterized protein YdhG (YjbR/CyaY superfamily)